MATIPAANANAGTSPSSSYKRASSTTTASSLNTRKDAIPHFGIMWTIMRSIGDMSLPFFFSSVSVSSPSHVPPSTTPLIVCSNHSNTILDVAILASHFPERRPLHFWAKSGFFHNPILRFILTSSGNIKVDRRNKNNQALFEGTFEAMKAGGGIALFPEGGSFTQPKLAKLKMGAGWAALEYSRYLQLQQKDEDEDADGGHGKGKPRTEVKILPTAVVFDDKSVFRSRAVLKFGKPLSLDRYIDEFLSAPMEVDGAAASKSAANKLGGAAKEDGTVPATPESMTRSNTKTDPTTPHAMPPEQYASPAHRAVARLTADLQRAMEDLTFNAPDWETFQAVRMARELMFELPSTTNNGSSSSSSSKVVRDEMEQYVELSRALMTLLTLESRSASSQTKRQSKQARRTLFVYSSLLHLADADNSTLAQTQVGRWSFLTPLASLLLRLPVYMPVFGPTLIPTYILPNRLAHHFAGREEESLSSVKTLFSFFFTSLLYSTLLVKTMQWTRWSPPGLLVGVAGIWWLHDLNRSCIDTAYGLVKQIKLGWRMHRANVSSVSPIEKERKGKSLFFYGTLVHPKILARVIGNDGSHLIVQNGVLDGAKLFHVRGEEYPGLVQVDSTRTSVNAVKGTLVSGLTASDLRCLDAFEGDEYIRTRVSIIPDAQAPAERNSTRIANAGTAPLHAILSTLTKPRIESLCANTPSTQTVEAEAYTWIAGRDRLTDEVWEFDVFAQTHAANWVGEGAVEHEHEYQVVDRVRSSTDSPTSTPLLTASDAPLEGEEQEEENAWIEDKASTLVEAGSVRDAVVKVCSTLAVKPSIQFYVDQAFPEGEGMSRPRKGDRQLLSALLRARMSARHELQELLAMMEAVEDQQVQQAVALLSDAKSKALGKVGVRMRGEAAWPFSPTLVDGARFESKKTV